MISGDDKKAVARAPLMLNPMAAAKAPRAPSVSLPVRLFPKQFWPRRCCSVCQAKAAASAGKVVPNPAASAIQASSAAMAVLPSSTVFMPACGGVVVLNKR
ncbi:hypothetical protein THIOM_000260 [Candidatus Thiomargarita nelsonii]|uniref:Uncharacterized protein n=1 Tax=Candidatus Thiomargarita nelsonii TaxID=1003181 RepID=A0A176S7K1_9GAMM|nr:hypothetical protein THIOM_000260 [Candidatus Thiomargarita nelsonii]